MSVVASDDFNRADNADVGATWTPVGQALRITSNAAVFALGSDADSAETHTTTLAANHWAEAVISSPIAGGVGQGYGVIVRASTGASFGYYRAVGNSSGWSLDEFGGGAFVGNIASGATPTFAIGDTIYLEAQGTTLVVKKGTASGVGGTTVTTQTDATLTGTLAGIGYSSAGGGGGVDAFVMGDFAGGAASEFNVHNSRRNRPGRGPYSTGRYYRRSIEAFTTPVGGNVFQQVVSGGLTFVGIVSKQTRRELSGALTFVGTLAKQTARNLTGSVSFSGALTATVVFLRALTGAVSFSGALSKSTLKGLTGAVSFAGGVVKQTGKNLSGGLTFSGALAKRTARALSGTVSFAGSLLSSFTTSKALTGAVSFIGTLGTLLIPFVPGSAVKAWRKVWQGLWRQVSGSDE